MDNAAAWGVGIATVAPDDQVLDVWFPSGRLGLGAPPWPSDGPVTGWRAEAHALKALGTGMVRALGRDRLRDVRTTVVRVTLPSLAAAPVDAADAYLRLHLLSHRLIEPHGASLDGLFGLLANVAWTDLGPVPAELADEVRLRVRDKEGRRLQVFGVDKFPRMTDYVVPSGVRIGDADRVRLGAHLASGTTVMHSGFVNFNAGTLGTVMVEGRITSGTVVDDGSDIGAGASIMGTLSGGGTEVIRIGKRCLLGANSGVGISLGDDCVVEAGCYVTSGAKVTLPDGRVVKSREVAGADGLLFRRNSVSGALEVLPREGVAWTGLNTVLHANTNP